MAGIHQNPMAKFPGALEAMQLQPLILDRLQDCVVVTDLEGCITYVNRSFSTLLQRSKQELLGRSIAGLEESSPGGWSERKIIARTLESGEWRGEAVLTTRSGREILFDCRTHLARNSLGHACAIVGIGSAITPCQQTENRLQEYERVVENINEIIVILDRDYRFLIANRAFLKYRGIERNKVLGHTVAEVLGEELFAKVRERIDRCFEGRGESCELHYSFPAVGCRDVEVTYIPLEGSAGIDRVAWVLQDITERKAISTELDRHRQHLEELVKERTAELTVLVETLSLEAKVREKIEKRLRESENFYRTVFETTGTSMIVTEADTTISLANRQYEKLVGATKDESKNWKNWTETICGDDKKRIQAYHVMRRIDPQSVPNQYETQIADQQGRVKDVYVTVSMIPGTQKSVASLLDITRRKQAERELEQSNLELISLQRITRKLLGLESLFSVMSSIAEGIVGNIGYDIALVARFVEDGKDLTGFVIYPPQLKQIMVMLFGKESRWPLWVSRLRYIPGHNRNFDRVINGETLADPSLSTFISQWVPQEHSQLIQRHLGRVGYICQPMRVRDETVGVILAGWNDSTCQLERMRSALGRIADQAAVAIKSSALFELIQKQRIDLKSLAGKLQTAQENERKKIAQELHDRVGQNLTGLSLNLGIIRNLLPPAADARLLERISDTMSLVGDTMGCIRDVMSELHPPALTDCGLGPALKIHCQQLARRTGMNIQMMSTDVTFLPHRETELALFRIAQEALNNSIRHANAKNVSVKLISEMTKWVLSIVDDGLGMKQARPSAAADNGTFGLISMRERAEAVGGKLRVVSSSRRGTQIIVELPKGEV